MHCLQRQRAMLGNGRDVQINFIPSSDVDEDPNNGAADKKKKKE
jgi:hypothetical protein